MPFAIDETKSVVVVLDSSGEGLVGFRLEDGLVLYAESGTSPTGQLVFPIDLLPVIKQGEIREDLEAKLTVDDRLDLDSAMETCWSQHIDTYVTQDNLHYDSKAGGWRVNIGESVPSLTVFSGQAGRRWEEGVTTIRFDSPIKEVFLTTRAALAEV